MRFDLKEPCIGCERIDLKTDVLLEMDMGELCDFSHYELYLKCAHSDQCQKFKESQTPIIF